MGLSVASYTEMGLIERKHDIGVMLTILSNQKISLTREAQKASRNYQAALQSKVLTWSNNGGASYVDLSYDNLMRPSLMNQNTPYLLTDTNGRILIDKKYQAYAEMLSPDGKGGVEWESHRAEIISSLTGIPAETITGTATNQEEIWKKQTELANLENSMPEEPMKKGGVADFLKLAGNSTGASNGENFSKGSNWADAYDYGAEIKLGGAGDVESVLSSILQHLHNQLSPYLDEKGSEALEEAMDSFVDEMTLTAKNSDEKSQETIKEGGTPLTGSFNNGYSVKVKDMIDWVLESYADNGGDINITKNSNAKELIWKDLGTSDYEKWKADYPVWEAQYDAALAEYNTLVTSNNQALTADQETQIEFYDTLFSAIAEKGWIFNESVSDTEYLNQMLQNNIYTLTTVDRSSVYDEKENDYDWFNEYETNIASNHTNIFAVSNDDLREQALIEYENEKAIINEKETRIDTRMKKLETELSAINTELQSVGQQKKDHTDRYFSIMG